MGMLKNMVQATISGNVGAMNYRKRGNEVAVAARSYTNSSKASGASEAQRAHRIKLANLVNLYKVIAAVEAQAWEGKGKYQSDFNMLTKYNLAASLIYLTKNEASLGASVVAPYEISRGTLTPLEQSWNGEKFDCGIMVGPNFDFANNTVAGFTNGILNNNEGWQNGDKLTLVMLDNSEVILADGTVYPRAKVSYFEMTLDKTDTSSIASIANFDEADFECNSAKELFATGSHDACCLIHSRKVDGQLQVSTQSIILMDEAGDVYAQYTSDAQKKLAMDSYGYKADVLLSPDDINESAETVKATVSSVLYNGSELASGSTITGGNNLSISGADLNTSNVKVTCNGVVYVPTTETTEQMIYNIAEDGTLKVYINSKLTYTATVTGSPVGAWTSFQFGTTTYTKASSNRSDAANTTIQLTVYGSNLGSITATGATLGTVTSVTGGKQVNVTMPGSNTSYTVSVNGSVIISGTTPSGESIPA